MSKTVNCLEQHLAHSVQFSSAAQLCPTFWDPMNCSTPGLPVYNQLPEFTQTHVHWVSDAIQPSHPLSHPSPLAFNLSQHQCLFQWVSSLLQVAKGLGFQLQQPMKIQSFQLKFSTDFLAIGNVFRSNLFSKLSRHPNPSLMPLLSIITTNKGVTTATCRKHRCDNKHYYVIGSNHNQEAKIQFFLRNNVS